MITLKIEDYCHDCEGFDPCVKKIYEFKKGYTGTEITCSMVEKFEKLEKQNKDVEKLK